MTDMLLVYITTPNGDEARDIGKKMVTERLAACANIFDGMQSVYRWDGKLCEETESVLLLKTRQELLDALTARVRSLHSYTTPCIVAIPVAGGDPEYLSWLGRETGNIPQR